MEQSIETIWKQGFLNGDALIAPKVNDIYNMKSMHIIDKFERLSLMNIRGIIIGASLLFLMSYFAGASLAGAIILLMMLYVAYTAHHELKALEKIEKGQSSYAFLKSFKDWICNSIDHYGKMYRVVYPVLILTVYFGIWFSDVFESMRTTVLERSTDLIFGLHIYTTILVLMSAVLMSVFSKAIHKRDVKTIYGGILKKLDLALAEMEELRDN
jgi:F0F1-type ATP synthase assembly protein I